MSVPDNSGRSTEAGALRAGAGSSSKSVVANAGWNMFSTVWAIATSFLLAPIVIHNLGTEEYGILVLTWSFAGLLSVINMGIPEGTLRYIAFHYGVADTEGMNRVMGSTLSFYTALCAIAALAAVLGGQFLVSLVKIPNAESGLLLSLIYLTVLIFSLRVFSGAYAAVPVALGRYDINSKFFVIQSVVRTVGYLVLAKLRFGLLYLVTWDLACQLAFTCAQIAIARRMLPTLTLAPSFSFKGLREIAGFSVYSFLTYLFHMGQREGGKMVLASQLGAAPVAYLGTPDNVAQRIHMVVASGSETLMPRFSANRDLQYARNLVLHGTWASLVISLLLILPFVVLLPDFLRLWINEEFARESSQIGQLVALSYISQGAYAPVAAFFRGTGRPQIVTVTIFLAGLITVAASWMLVPKFGLIGIGYAYLLGSVPALIGLLHGWFVIFGRSSSLDFARLIVLPLLSASIALPCTYAMRNCFSELTWFTLLMLGGVSVGFTTLLTFGADFLISGNDAPSKRLIARVIHSERLRPVFRYIPLRTRMMAGKLL